ncbi:O-antigen ligase family protein [Marinobacter sp. SS21]|uniref:O-antigen ligase family protein n=1 Tax=Marinobacter sp. SS21 TaxID=2979460 RepID=UPI0023310EA0|nr:O-antigen ligase family protein [Marinobacter sp. SS21]MDC0664158.1 O-antigen ligase family protein [Marinobacter sp. SS21]
MTMVTEAWIGVLLLFAFLVYIPFKASSHRITYYEVYILAILLFVPLLGSLTAWVEFGQPILYGLLAQRNTFLSISSLMLLLMVYREYITLDVVERTFVFLSWLLLVTFTALQIFVDPTLFVDAGKGFVSGSENAGYEFRLKADFIIFGLLYYAFVGFRKRNARAWFFASLFMLYLVILDEGRTLIVSSILASAFFIFKWSKAERFLAFFPKIIIALSIILASLYYVNGNNVLNLGDRFSSAFTVLFSQEMTSDFSANARIIETRVAIPYIEKNPLFGNGIVSHKWKGGYEGVMGEYFYPSDIGVIGVVFIYGIIGLFAYLLQFYFAWYFSSRVSERTHMPFLDAIKGYILFFLIHSLITGHFVHHLEIGLFFVMLLALIYKEIKLFQPNSKANSITIGRS